MTPGTWIKWLRLTKEVKQSDIAGRMGITQQAYSKIENSDWINRKRLPQILMALESTPEELIRVAELFSKKQAEAMAAETSWEVRKPLPWVRK